MRLSIWATFALALLAAGCGDDEDGDGTVDGGAVDARVVDGGAVDAALIDAAAAVGDGAAADAAALDAAAGGVFRIEEVLVGVSLQPATQEYVEISGPPGASLDGLSIRVINSNGMSAAKRTYALSATAGAVMPADGRWVMGGALVTGTDRTLSITTAGDDWDLDSTAGAIQLLMAGVPPTLIDVVGWGAAVTPSGNLTAPTATAEGTPAVLPTAVDRSMGRRVGSTDTGNNMADFCVQAKSSGGANSACL